MLIDSGPANLQHAEVLLAGAQFPNWPQEAHDRPPRGAELRQTVADFAGELAAGIAGTVAYGVITMESRGALRALSLPVAAAAGAITKYAVRSMVESVLLPPELRRASTADLGWGAVAGLAGVAGGFVEQRVARSMLTSMGQRALGSMAAQESYELVGRQLVQQYVLPALRVNTVRGIAGGGAGTLAWSLPRRTYEHRNQLFSNPLSTLATIGQETASDTVFGALTGGTLAAGGTTLMRVRQICSNASSVIRGRRNLTLLDEYAVNDFHSNLDQLPSMKTKADQLIHQSNSQGRNTEFVVAGDPLSGHVNFSFTHNGEVEYRALARVGSQADRTIIIPGNHEYDAAGGRFFPERLPGVLEPVLQDYPRASFICANLDFSAYPQYQALVRPNITYQLLRGPNGPQIAATVGLTTQEGALGRIVYQDAAQVAVEQVRQLNAQGIRIITLKTHVDFDEARRIARTLLDNNLVVAKITDGHGHRTIPIHWEGSYAHRDSLNRARWWQPWRAFMPQREIPITQAGSSGRWLGQTELAIRPDGSADRYFTRATLHPITSEIPENLFLRQYIDNAAYGSTALRETRYGVTASETYALTGTRTRETALGNLVADATLHGLQNNPEVRAPQIALVHSGGIRADIFSGHELTRLDIANTMMSAGKREAELLELVGLQMTGRDIRSTLEFGIKDIPTQTRPSLADRVRTIFGFSHGHEHYDAPGNFLQVSGLRYSLDLSRPPMSRVTGVQIPVGQQWQPLTDEAVYSVVTRFHAVDKWNAARLFGDRTIESTHALLQATPVRVSQVDLIGDYVRNRGTISPQTFSSVEGRIMDSTPRVRTPSSRPGFGLGGLASAAAADQSN